MAVRRLFVSFTLMIRVTPLKNLDRRARRLNSSVAPPPRDAAVGGAAVPSWVPFDRGWGPGFGTERGAPASIK